MARELAPVSINTRSGASLLEDEWSFPFLAAVLELPKLRSAWQALPPQPGWHSSRCSDGMVIFVPDSKVVTR